MIRTSIGQIRLFLKGEAGQGTVEYTVLTGVAVLGMVAAFDILDIGTFVGTWLKGAIDAATP